VGVQEAVLVEEPKLKLLGTTAAFVILTFITEGRNEALFLFEVAVGLLGIEDGWHEVGPVVAPFEQSGIGGEEIIGGYGGVGMRRYGNLYYQYAKHLSFRQRHTLQFLLYLLGREPAKRVRLVTKGIGKPLWSRNIGM
jgi:hypothetical protein